MRILTVMVVYDRWRNTERWKRVWKAIPRGADDMLCIVRNVDDAEGVRLVEDGSPLVIERPNVGMDIGTYQDVIRGRIPGLPEWDWLLCVSDDFLPMRLDFLETFRAEAIQSELIAIVASKPGTREDIAAHFRTSGFMIRRDAAERIEWPADPMQTREQCFDFEHRSHNLMQQIFELGLMVRFVPDDRVFWDQGHEEHLQRLPEFPAKDLCDVLHYSGSDKSSVHSYCDVYERFCSRFRNTHLPILELGVHQGASQ